MNIKYTPPPVIEVQDDGYSVSADVDNINFGDGLVVTDDGYGKVTVDAYSEDGDTYCLVCAFDGNANNGRVLEFFKNNNSFDMPFVPRGDGEITDLSYTSRGASTGAVTIRINGVGAYNLTILNQQKKTVNGLSVPFNGGDEISLYVSTGSLNRPNLFIFFKDG